MNQATKQRLVGTLVLACLALIFIPLLLDGEGITPAGIETTPPPAPDISFRNLPEPVPPVIDADSLESGEQLPADDLVAGEAAADLPPVQGPTDTSTAEAETETPTTAADTAIALPVPADRSDPAATDVTPQRGADGLPEAWTVRVGVFGNRANADTLQACLILEGYKAYSRQQAADTGNVTRVFVGPVATRAEATTLGAAVVGKCGLQESGIPLQYTP